MTFRLRFWESHKEDVGPTIKSHATPDGRIIYDVQSEIFGPSADRHFQELDSWLDKCPASRPEAANK